MDFRIYKQIPVLDTRWREREREIYIYMQISIVATIYRYIYMHIYIWEIYTDKYMTWVATANWYDWTNHLKKQALLQSPPNHHCIGSRGKLLQDFHGFPQISLENPMLPRSQQAVPPSTSSQGYRLHGASAGMGIRPSMWRMRRPWRSMEPPGQTSNYILFECIKIIRKP